jgi:hypothetical protein
MTDLNADAPIRFLGVPQSEKFFVDTTYAQTIYKGQPMYIDQSVDTLNAMPFVTAKVIAPTDICLGIAAHGLVLAAAAAETTEVEVYVGSSIIGFKSTVFDNADLGKVVYMSDSATLSETAADNPEIGKLVKVEDGYCYVELTTPKIASGA